MFGKQHYGTIDFYYFSSDITFQQAHVLLTIKDNVNILTLEGNKNISLKMTNCLHD